MGWGSGNLGGGSGKLFAAIGVTYPEGSTLTCTDGKKTLKAKTTTGLWLFSIPYAGTWTVTATDGTDSESETVEITTEGQSVNVELSYATWLYNYETQEFGAQFNSVAKKFNSGSTVTEAPAVSTLTDGSLEIKQTTRNGCGMWYSDAIDLTDYNTLYVLDKSSGESNARTDIAIWSSVGAYVWGNVVAHIEQANRDEQLRSIDVSALNGQYHIGYAMYNPNTTTITLKQMYLV